jgi:hypothetical protein
MRRILRFHTPFESGETTVFDGGSWKSFATHEHLPRGFVPAEARVDGDFSLALSRPYTVLSLCPQWVKQPNIPLFVFDPGF